jgi:hypothetical protein
LDKNDPGLQNGRYIYVVGKTVAEKKVWELAEANPDVDITARKLNITIYPSSSHRLASPSPFNIWPVGT